MHLKATLTIDQQGIEDIVRSHVATAGYVLEEIHIDMDDPPQIRCDVRPMTPEEAAVAGLDTRPKEAVLREMLGEYTRIVQAHIESIEETLQEVHAVVSTPRLVEPPVLTEEKMDELRKAFQRHQEGPLEDVVPLSIGPTYLGAEAALSAEASALRKQKLRQQMKAEAVLISNPIEAFEEYPHD